MSRIVELDVIDVRFPTSRSLDGSDAMNPDPDYSAAYVILRDDAGDGLEGHGLTFTIGRGTEVVVAAVQALRPLVLGRSSEELFADMGAFWRSLVAPWIGGCPDVRPRTAVAAPPTRTSCCPATSSPPVSGYVTTACACCP